MVTGIIVEYNPFHNGHLYHIQKAQAFGEPIIAIMSGVFTQRGEPALLSKYTRTQCALDAGVDIVLELPHAYGMQRADIFSDAAFFLLSRFPVKRLICGTENGSLDVSSQPNARLAQFYKRSSAQYGIEVRAIRRIPHQSASFIRSQLAQNQSIASYVPSSIEHLLKQYHPNNECFYTMIRHTLFAYPHLHHIALITTNMIKRLQQAALIAHSYHDWCRLVKRKHETMTHIQRASIHLFSQTMWRELDKATNQPPYVRVLGFSKRGQQLLHDTTFAIGKSLAHFADHPAAHLEAKITRLAAVVFPQQRPYNEYKNKPIQYDQGGIHDDH